jgi:hypothetical protein
VPCSPLRSLGRGTEATGLPSAAAATGAPSSDAQAPDAAEGIPNEFGFVS